MTSEDQALFLLGKLMGATELLLAECDRFKHSKSVDMSGYHGVSIQVPQGQKGKSWHDAHNGLLKIRQEIRENYKMSEDWEIFSKNIDAEVFR